MTVDVLYAGVAACGTPSPRSSGPLLLPQEVEVNAIQRTSGSAPGRPAPVVAGAVVAAEARKHSCSLQCRRPNGDHKLVESVLDHPDFSTTGHALAERTIWTWWSSGKDALNPFLQICLESWQVHHPDWSMVVLDLQNVWQYLTPDDLPSSFNQISRASLQSDLVRLAILAKFGGCYIDTSCVALENIADAAWARIGEGACLAGYRAPHFISDFVSAWFLASKAGEPLMVEWSRSFNKVMEDSTEDTFIHKHIALIDLDLTEYLKQGYLASKPGTSPSLWVDYLIVNVVLKSVLDNDDALKARFWGTASLVAEADPKSSPTLWSQAQQHIVPKGIKFPETERMKMQKLLEQDPHFTTRLLNLSMLKFFDSGRTFASFSQEELLSSPSILGSLLRKALGGFVDRSSTRQPFPPLRQLQAVVPFPENHSSRLAITWEFAHGVLIRAPDLEPTSVAIVTFATDHFNAIGATCLARSLNTHSGMRRGTRMFCLVSSNTDQMVCSMLEDEGWQVLRVDSLNLAAYSHLYEGLENPNCINGYLKLELWNLQQLTGQVWNRVMYITCDAIVVGNLEDALYAPDMEPPTDGIIMALDYDWRSGLLTAHSPWTPNTSAHMSVTSAASTALPASSAKASSTEPLLHVSNQFDDSSEACKFRKSKDSYSKAHRAAAFKEESYCNAGVMMLRPSQAQYDRLLKTLKTFKHRGLAEQDLFHEVFTCRGCTKVCEQGYNAQKWLFMCAPEIWQTFDLKIIHYNNEKPWALEGCKVVQSIKKENRYCEELVSLWHKVNNAGFLPTEGLCNHEAIGE